MRAVSAALIFVYHTHMKNFLLIFFLHSLFLYHVFALLYLLQQPNMHVRQD